VRCRPSGSRSARSPTSRRSRTTGAVRPSAGGSESMARYVGADCRRCRRKETEYLLQLREKQKARRVYGVLEKQFQRYYDEAVRKPGKTGEILLQILESRLDNVVYRAGYAQSRDMARQLVKHGHFVVNGVKVDIPSYRVKEHDIVTLREKSKEMTPFVI